jgi:hypothetical protein
MASLHHRWHFQRPNGGRVTADPPAAASSEGVAIVGGTRCDIVTAVAAAV